MRSLGDAWVLLARHDDARRAYALGAASLDAEAMAPEDRLGLVLGLARGDDALVAEALELTREALSDANAWWDLPRVARAVVEVRDAGFFTAPRREAAREVASRLRQRVGGAALADALLSRLDAHGS